MQDNLKNHIESNRAEFELYPFESSDEWQKMVKKITRASKKSWNVWGLTGAACLGLIFLGAILTLNITGTESEIAELESFYAGEINYKVSLIKNQVEDDEILKDLEEMDQVFTALKSDLKDDVDNEEVIMAMMENYQLKLQILEEILIELEKEKDDQAL